MKLSEKTLTILKNFSTINSGIVFRPGKTLTTMAPDVSVLAEAEIEEEIPVEFGIYDLNQFLGNITTMSDPELDIEKTVVHIKDKTFVLDYRVCPTELIISPPIGKKLSLGTPDVSFDLTADQMGKLLRLATMNELPNVTIKSSDGSLIIQAHELGNDSTNTVRASLGDWTGPAVSATFKAELLKIIPDDYTVEIKLGKFARFTSKTNKLFYFISLEAKK